MKLIIEDDEGRKTVVPFSREEISIGRQDGNTIRLTERNVSRRHARLFRRNGSVLVEDLGSANGIRVNGERIEGALAIQEGDLIEIGDYDLALQAEAADSPAATAARAPTVPDLEGGHAITPVVGMPAVLRDPLPAPLEEDEPASHQATAIIRTDQLPNRVREIRDLPESQRPRLVIVSSDQAGQETTVQRSEFRIGRTTGDNDLAINHRSISRNHAKLVLDPGGGWRLLDLQSANGVRVNGEDYADAPLVSGDLIELGHVKLRFIGPGEPYAYQPEEGPTPAPGEQRGMEKPAERKPAAKKPSEEPIEEDTEAGARPSKTPLYAAVGVGGTLVVAFVIYLAAGGRSGPVRTPSPTPAAAVAAKAPAHLPEAAPAPVPSAPVTAPPARHEAPPSPPAPVVAEEPVRQAAPAAAAKKPAEKKVDRRRLATLLAQGKAALKAHRLGAAEAKIRDAMEIAPDDPGVARLRGALETAKEREASRSARRHERPAAATAATAAPAAPAAVDRRAQAASDYEAGVEAVNEGDLRGAVAALQRAVQEAPGMADAHKALGICYAKLQEPEKAAPQYKQYLRLKPNAADAPTIRKILSDYYGHGGH